MKTNSPRRYVIELSVPALVIVVFYLFLIASTSSHKVADAAASTSAKVEVPAAKIDAQETPTSLLVPPPVESKTEAAPIEPLIPAEPRIVGSAPGQPLQRSGDEIVACGQFFHTGTPVVLWMDPGGYDAYRVEARFAPFDKSNWESASTLYKGLNTPNRYGLRKELLSSDEIERVRGGGWDLPLLQRVVDQFVLHYDVAGTSRACFRTLHDLRCLSVHFMLDVDGTLYQTLDLKERAWHATTSNTRSVGIEIANIGAYPASEIHTLDRWYSKDEKGSVTLIIPKGTSIRTANFEGHPLRKEIVAGAIQGTPLNQYDFTPQQYDALIKLTATLCKIFPNIKCDYPRDENGALIPHKLADDQLKSYRGVLGHYHIQKEKIDPGPALQWDLVIDSARKLMDQK